LILFFILQFKNERHVLLVFSEDFAFTSFQCSCSWKFLWNWRWWQVL